MRRLTIVVLTAAALLAGACGSDDADDSASESSSSTTASTIADDNATTGVPGGESTTPIDEVDVQLVDLDLDLSSPIDLTFRPGSTSLLIAERDGRVREAVPDGNGFRLADDPVLDITGLVGDTDSEKGLLGIAVSPDGNELYASYTEADNGDSRIDAYPLSGNDGALRADVDGRRELVAIEQPFPNHNGGSLAIGPDGMLYAGFGDGGDADDPEGNGQNPDTLLGKILRLDPAQDDAVPLDNPFVEGGGEPLIWATGLRNPWRMSFDSQGRLWVADVGQNEFEEINVLVPEGDAGAGAGANLGWDLFEGTSRFADSDPADGAASGGPFVEPVYVYSHDDGCSVSGGVVYEGAAIPDLTGAYLFGDYCTPGVRAIRVEGTRTVDEADLGVDVGSVVSFGRGPDGEVYVVSLDDGIKRLEPA